MEQHKQLNAMPDPRLHPVLCCKRHYWVNWQNWNTNGKWNKNIISMFNFLMLITVLWLFKIIFFFLGNVHWTFLQVQVIPPPKFEGLFRKFPEPLEGGGTAQRVRLLLRQIPQFPQITVGTRYLKFNYCSLQRRSQRWVPHITYSHTLLAFRSKSYPDTSGGK